MLLKMRKILLEKCEEVISQGPQWPFVSKGLETKKIFQDLRSYFNKKNNNKNHAFNEYDAAAGNLAVSFAPHRTVDSRNTS